MSWNSSFLAKVLLFTLLAIAPFSASAVSISPFPQGFGSVDSNTLGGSWEEDDGNSSGTELVAAGVDNNSASPGGGAFARADGDGGWFCHPVVAAGYNLLQMSYYWRGDANAEASDSGLVQYKTSGACADASGWTTLQTHDLSNDGSWSTQSLFSLPVLLDDSSFFLRFESDSSNTNEDFRLDDISITGSFIDVTPPSVLTVSASAPVDGAYTVGQVVSVTVQFNEAVVVTGAPLLTLETGATDRQASYAGGSGTDTLTFTYTVVAGDTSADLDYVSTSALALNGGSIKDMSLNGASLTLVGPGTPGSLGANRALVIDTTAPADPTLTSIATDNYVNASEAGAALFVGTGEPNASVTIAIQAFVASVYSNLPDAVGVVLPDGTFSIAVDLSGADDNTINAQVRVTDAAGNNSAWVNGPVATKDVIAPTVTDLSALLTPSNSSPLNFSATFSESVTGFSDTDPTVGGVGGTVSNVAGGPSSYTFDITPSGEGVFTVDLGAGTVFDLAGNPNDPAVQESATYDLTAPAVWFTAGPAHLSYINTNSTAFEFSTSDALSTPVTTECRLVPDAFASCTSPHALAGLSEGLQIFRVRATDAATNVSPTIRRRFTVDTIKPTVTLTTGVISPTTTNADPILVTAQFSEDVTGFDAGDLSVTNGTVSLVTGVGSDYGIEITPTADGPVTVSVNADGATDVALNGNEASAAIEILSDRTAPVVTLVGAPSLYVLHNGSYTEEGATALDAIDGPVPVTVTGVVDTAVFGLYIVTYTATDAAGNSGMESRFVYINPACSDTFDNDLDTLTDDADPDCHIDNDALNPLSYFADDNDEATPAAPVPTPTPSLGGGVTGLGGGGGGQVLGVAIVNTGVTGQVLGISTTTEALSPEQAQATTQSQCASGAYITNYLRSGVTSNDVRLLQEFLNTHLGLSIAVTGFFGPQTVDAVKLFQERYANEILAPWGLSTPTGYVYKTTLRWINVTACGIQIPMPAL